MKNRDFKNHETKTVYDLLSNDEGFYNMCELMKASSENWIELSCKLRAHFEYLAEVALDYPTRDLVQMLMDVGSICDIDFDHIAQELFQE